MIKRDIDACVLQAADFDEFVLLLRDKGYEVKQNKYFAIKPPGLARFRRCYRLGEDYSEERLRERVISEDLKYYQEHHTEAKIIRVAVPYHLKRAKISGLQRKYFVRLYSLGKMKARPYSQAYKYRDEIRKMHKLHDQYMFLADYEIHSDGDLLKVYDALKSEKEQLSKERSLFYKEKSRYNRLWKLADRMHELTPAEKTFMSGDTFFRSEHEEYAGLQAEIQKAGYSLAELDELRTYYSGKSLNYQDMQKDCNKRIRIAESLIREVNEDQARDEVEIHRDLIRYSGQSPNRTV
jgi:hypothetical protein